MACLLRKNSDICASVVSCNGTSRSFAYLNYRVSRLIFKNDFPGKGKIDPGQGFNFQENSRADWIKIREKLETTLHKTLYKTEKNL